MLFGKITTMRFNFLKLLDRILLYLNVVSNDVTITSSLRIDVIILGANFLFSEQNRSSRRFVPKITKRRLYL